MTSQPPLPRGAQRAKAARSCAVAINACHTAMCLATSALIVAYHW